MQEVLDSQSLMLKILPVPSSKMTGRCCKDNDGKICKHVPSAFTDVDKGAISKDNVIAAGSSCKKGPGNGS